MADLEPLTPNHLLIGTSSVNTCPAVINDKEINLRRKWRSVQAAANMFWVRWVRKYLPTLSIRKKWNSKQRNFKVGDLVIVNVNDTQRSSWPLGRIVEIYTGSNDVVRTVKIKTGSGYMTRPSSKIALLEATNE